MTSKKGSTFHFFHLFLFSILILNYYCYSFESKVFLNEEPTKETTNEVEPDIAKLEKIFSDLFPEGEPAAAVLIKKDENILFEKYYGLSSLPNGSKTDENTTFNIASNSKQFTSVAVLQLVEKGIISLDEPLSTYFPKYTDPLWQKVKVKHLLSHSSGIPDARGYLNRSQKITGDEKLALEYLDNLTQLQFEPGSDYEYVNPTYVLLGKLVEIKSGLNFTNYVQEHIFNPANMTQSAYIFQEKDPCHGYEYDRDQGDSEESAGDRPPGPHDWYEYDYGEETFFATRPDGGIYTNVRDFIKWEKAKPSLLREDLLNAAYSPQIKVYGSKWSDYQNRPGTYYGYGWFIEPEKKCIYHTGDNGGFKILAARYPEKNTIVLVFAARADWDRYGLKTQIEEIFDLVPKPKSNEKIIFVLQIQKIEKKLKIFCVTNFPIANNEKISFYINTYTIYTQRALSLNNINKLTFISSKDYTGDGDKIIELTSQDEFDGNIGGSFQELKYDDNITLHLNANKNNLDLVKVKEEISKGGIDYNNIPAEHKVYHYKISSASEGCEFNLIADKNIDINNDKKITLKFNELDKDINIYADCTLTKSSEKKIACKISEDVNRNYILDPFIYSDSSSTVTIMQNDPNRLFHLKCTNPPPKNEEDKSSRGLPLGIIILIVSGALIFVIVIIIIIVIIVKKKMMNNGIDEMEPLAKEMS